MTYVHKLLCECDGIELDKCIYGGEAECLKEKGEINGCCNEINEFWVLNACDLGKCIDV